MAMHITTWLTSTSHGWPRLRRPPRTPRYSAPRGGLEDPGERPQGVGRRVAAEVGRALVRRGQGEDGRGEEDERHDEGHPDRASVPPRTPTSTSLPAGPPWKPVHEQHGEVHDGMDQGVGQVEAVGGPIGCSGPRTRPGARQR